MSWLLRACALGAAAVVPWMQMRLDRQLGRFRAQEEVLYVWSGEKWRRLAPGFESLLADVYWLRTIQYYGGVRVFARDGQFDLLAPLIDITVALDPRFEIAYRYGATFLCGPAPDGAGRPDLGVALLERGVQKLPDAWYMYQLLGVLSHQYLRDTERGAKWLLYARERPGAPDWLATLAADLLSKAGEREKSRRLWLRIAETSEGPMRENALTFVYRSEAEDQIWAWARLLAAFHTSRGRYPASLREVQHLAPGLPAADPRGVPYAYDLATGTPRVSRESVLYHPELDKWAERAKAAADAGAGMPAPWGSAVGAQP